MHRRLRSFATRRAATLVVRSSAIVAVLGAALTASGCTATGSAGGRAGSGVAGGAAGVSDASASNAAPHAASADVGRMVDRLPVVNAVIDSQAVTLLLDTGASITCLQPAASARIGRTAVGTSRLGGVGDTTRSVRTFGAATIALGGFATTVRSLHGCPALTLLADREAGIDGVLGADALRGLTVIIDYPDDVVRAVHAWSAVASDSTTTVPLTFPGGLPVIRVELWSRGQWEPLALLLDTGADASILLDPTTASALALEPDPFSEPAERQGLGGDIATQPHHAPRTRIGMMDVRDVTIEVATTRLNQLLAHGVQGVVGADFLRHFRIALDLGNARVAIGIPGAERVVCGTRSGICVVPRPDRDGYVVQSVRPRSPGARHGIAPGETIVRIGASDTRRLGPAEVRALLAPANGLLSLWVTSGGGRSRRVDLRMEPR